MNPRLVHPRVDVHHHPLLSHTTITQAPDKPTYIELDFEHGDPVKLDGVALSPAAMLAALNKVAGDNGIGRVDIVESRFVGEGTRCGVCWTGRQKQMSCLTLLFCSVQNILSPVYEPMQVTRVWQTP